MSTTSRLRSMIDPLSQTTLYSYNADDTLKALSYLNAINPTPPVNLPTTLLFGVSQP